MSFIFNFISAVSLVGHSCLNLFICITDYNAVIYDDQLDFLYYNVLSALQVNLRRYQTYAMVSYLLHYAFF